MEVIDMKRIPIILPKFPVSPLRKSYGYIYLVTNKANYKRYIGQHKSSEFDLEYMGSGYALNKAFKKYGKKNFTIEIIDWASNKLELNEKEKLWIKYLEALDSDEFYNQTIGGDGGDTWTNQPLHRKKEISKVLSQRCSGEKNGNYGHKWTEEQRKHLSEYRTGLKDSPKAIESKRQAGLRRWKNDPEARERLRFRTAGSKNPAAHPVVQLTKDMEFIAEWNYVSEPIKLGIITGDIGACCRGEQKTAGGYKWMYKEDYDQYLKEKQERGE